jgi:internalin A
MTMSERGVLSLKDRGLKDLPTTLLDSIDTAGIYLLDLGHNNLSSLNEGFLRRFPNLRQLILADNEFREFPSSLRLCLHLEQLDLDLNFIRQLDLSRGYPPRLRVISVRRNGLEQIDESINLLSRLEVLDVADNLVSTIPPLRTPALRELVLGSNPGLDIVDELQELRRLEFLDLSNNGLTELQFDAANLGNNCKVDFSRNFLPYEASVAAEQGSKEALTYVRSLSEGVLRVYEAKVILVGEGNVGKTSLVAALRGEPFVRDRPTTHGIEVRTLLCPHPDPNIDATLTLRTWDFGGQDIYRVTHQFFFSDNAVYLVAWRPREGHEENGVRAWIKRIRARVGSAARIFVVATHGNERQAEIDFPALRREFGDVLVGMYVVDSFDGRGIEDLRTALIQTAAALPSMGGLTNTDWHAARTAVENLSLTYITRTDFARICESFGLVEDEQDVIAKTMHEMGLIVHFADEDGLRDILVLQPEWLTKAISYVLEDGPTRKRGGLLPHEDLERVWCDKERDTQYPKDLHPYFLRLMEKFDVSYRVEDSEASLVAQLFPYERPELPELGHSISLTCRFSDVPHGLIPWLVARNHRFTTGRHWRDGVLLQHRRYSNMAILELTDELGVRLSVGGDAPRFFFSVLRDTLEHLCETRWPGLSYRLMVPCSSTIGSIPCKGEFPVRSLEMLQARGTTTITCLECLQTIEVASLLDGFKEDSINLPAVLSSQISQVERSLALQAEALRIILRSLESEVSDCPRLVSLTPADYRVFDPRQAWKSAWKLTLWCEEHGSEHPMDPSYSFSRPKEWFADVAPYIRIAARALSLVAPIVGAGSTLITEDSSVADISKLMSSLGAALNAPQILTEDSTDAVLSRAEGAALRRLRSLILELDPSRDFAGLRRVLAPTGQYLWLCEDHYRLYEPGIPHLAYVGATVAPARALVLDRGSEERQGWWQRLRRRLRRSQK